MGRGRLRALSLAALGLAALAAAALSCTNPLRDTIDELIDDYQAELAGEQPEINLKWGSTDIWVGKNQSLGSVDQEWPVEFEFTIENTGQQDLVLTSAPAVRLSVGSLYEVTSQPASPIPPGGSATFAIELDPVDLAGTPSVTVTIDNDDPDELAYSFTLSAVAGKYQGYKAIDATGDVGEHSSIGVHEANVYIAYYDVNNSRLKLATSRNGGYDWSSVQVDNSGDVGRYCSLCLDDDTLYVSYYDATNTSLKLGKSPDEGESWNIETVDDAGDVGRYSSIDVGGDGTIYVSYYDADQKALKLAKYWFQGPGWVWTITEKHDSATTSTDIGKYTAVAEYGGDYYISYYHYTTADRDLYAHFADVFQELVTGSTTTDDGYWSSIAVAGSTVYISYFSWVSQGSSNARISLAKSTIGYGDAWSIVDVDPGGVLFASSDLDFGYTSIAVSGSNVFVSYCGKSNANPADPLSFAKSTTGGTAGSWALTVVDNSIAQVGHYNSIAVNGTDGRNVYISYHDESNGDLKFARSADGGASWN
ncbi:MAG: DUF1573 domain-containing protein [Spirochaetales bacterium]|nr:DUF1573 domain-containing protein [Spirochaetales bacterium]